MDSTLYLFDTGVCEKIGYYVYRLVNNGETFYIGKGKGNRVFEHEIQAKNESDDSFNLKLKSIKDAKARGTFEIVIHRHGLSEEQAFLLESALIDMHESYGKTLTNIQSGHQQSRYGVCSPEQLKLIYSMPKTSIQKATKDNPANTLLISINSSWSKLEKTPDGILKMVQYSWRIKKSSVESIPYVFAVANGIVRGVYKVNNWLESTDNEWINIIGRDEKNLTLGRYGFTGSIAPIEVWVSFVNTRLPETVSFGSGQPILYGYRK